MFSSIRDTVRDREMMRTIFCLAWPTVMEQALQTVVQYADTAQVGAIGANASAAVGLTTTMMWLINAPMFALAMGVLSCISRALGAKDTERAQKAAAQSVLITAALGVALGAVTLSISPFLPGWLGAAPEIQKDASVYFAIVCAPMLFRASSIVFGSVLRATGNTKTPMVINTIMNIMNIVLNFLLINPSQTWKIGSLSIPMWGAGLGVAGAAIATAAAYAAGGILMAAAAWRDPVLGLRGRKIRYDGEVMGQCIRIGTPIAAERVTACLGQVVFTSLIARLGTIAMAAHSIAITAEQAFYIPGYGMQAAAATLSGHSAGAKDEKKLMQYSSTITMIAVLFMGLLSVLLFLFPSAVMQIFSRDREVIGLGAQVLRIVAVSEPFFAVVIIMEGVFNGVGDTKIPFVFSLVSMWGVRILFTYLCVSVFHLGLTAVWLCMVGDNMTRFVCMVIRYGRGSWKKHLGFSSAKKAADQAGS